MKSIASALATAQMKMGKALKQTNNPHFRSKYADLGAVADACLPALNESGIAVIQPTGEDETGRFVETVFIHGESGEKLSCRVPLIVQKNDMQGYGSAVTYARRYGLMTMAGIAPEDDDGVAASKAAPKSEAPQQRQEQKSQEPNKETIEHTIGYLGQSDSLDDLKERWLNIPDALRQVSSVVEAKDKTKARLTPSQEQSVPDQIDLGGEQ